MEPKLLKTIFYAIALALGVAVIVLTILNTFSASTGWVLLGLAVVALGLAGLQK